MNPAKKLCCMLLILRGRFWGCQWMQGVRLWKKCLLSRGISVENQGSKVDLTAVARAVHRTHALVVHAAFPSYIKDAQERSRP